MIKAIWIALGIFLSVSLASAATINAKGASGVCVAVTTGSAVTILDANSLRTGGTIFCSQAMNCEPGPPTGGAPGTTPTTGAVGTGAGFPFPASVFIVLSSDRSISTGTVGGYPLNLDPAARLDCIAQTANGNCCTWEVF